MLSLPPFTLRLCGWKLIDRVALAFLILCAVALGAGCGLLFVYASDLPEIRALETYRPDVVTEVYADDGQLAGSFALQRRILMTYEQCPKILYSAVIAIEDQHLEHAAGRKSFPGPQRPQLPPQNAGNSARPPDRAPLHEAANLHHVRQPGLSGARQLRFCRGRAILFWPAGHGPEASGSRTSRGHGQRPEIFATLESGSRPQPAQSGDPSHGRGREDHARGRSERSEIAAWPAHPVSAQRSCSLFLRGDPQVS